ncbi:hypothetical protein HOV93_23960 [Planctomycetes bacterium FF15]|uniref:Uncharacterized protein n=1 Tax=Bremerella alba TaxID=980252 RepID=A0A7V9A7F2_9BACT|nr:hypothetical protein [Bremerella alba]
MKPIRLFHLVCPSPGLGQGIIRKLNIRCKNNIRANIIPPPRGYYLAGREGS